MQNKWFVEAVVVHHGSSLTMFAMKQFAPLWKPLQKLIQRSQNHQWFHPMVYVWVDVAEVTSISARRSLRCDLNLAISDLRRACEWERYDDLLNRETRSRRNTDTQLKKWTCKSQSESFVYFLWWCRCFPAPQLTAWGCDRMLFTWHGWTQRGVFHL